MNLSSWFSFCLCVREREWVRKSQRRARGASRAVSARCRRLLEGTTPSRLLLMQKRSIDEERDARLELVEAVLAAALVRLAVVETAREVGLEPVLGDLRVGASQLVLSRGGAR